MQGELEAVHQHLTQQQRSNLAKMEKQGWEAADWKARALESAQKLAAANAQVTPAANMVCTGQCLLSKLFLAFVTYLCCLCCPCQGSVPKWVSCLRRKLFECPGVNLANAAMHAHLAILCPSGAALHSQQSSVCDKVACVVCR